MASAARKPYRKAPPQHRETRHALPIAAPAPASHLDVNQVNTLPLAPPPPQHQLPHLAWDSDPDASSLSSLDACIPPPPPFSSQKPRSRTLSPQGVAPASSGAVRGERRRGQRRLQMAATPAVPPRGILKQPAPVGAEHQYDTVRKTKSVELLGGQQGRRSSDPPTSCLEERRRFSHFLDEITHRVLSPARLSLLGRTVPLGQPRSPAPSRRRGHTGRKSAGAGLPSERTRRWDSWVAAVRRPGSLHRDWRPEGAGLVEGDVTEGASSAQEGLWAGRGGAKVKAGAGTEPLGANYRPAAAQQSPKGLLKVGSPLLAPPVLHPCTLAPPTLTPPHLVPLLL